MTMRIDGRIKRAALYARVSTEEQAMHGVSLEAQRERLSLYAKENGLFVVDTYVDEGISARKRYTRRAEFMRMLGDVMAGKIDVVLFIKLDRWFRNVADYYEVQAILDRYGVVWIATEEDYDTATANGRLALNIKLAIAQDESDRTSERIRFVFQNMVKEGRVISGSTPLGYKIENKRAVLDEETAHITRDAFEKMADCRSVRETSRYLYEKYGVKMDARSLKRLLTNNWCIGEAYGVRDFCPAIVDRELFELVGNIINVRAERSVDNGKDKTYLFTGLVFCGCCGRRMTAYSCGNKRKDGSVNRYEYYRCPSHVGGACGASGQINEAILEEWLCERVFGVTNGYDFKITASQGQQSYVPCDAARIRTRLERLKDLYLDGLILRETYEKEYLSLKKRLERESKVSSQASAEEKTPILSMREAYAMLSEESKKAFWSRLISKINVSEDGFLSVAIIS